MFHAGKQKDGRDETSSCFSQIAFRTSLTIESLLCNQHILEASSASPEVYVIHRRVQRVERTFDLLLSCLPFRSPVYFMCTVRRLYIREP